MQAALERPSFDSQISGSLADIAPAFREHPLKVFPFHAVEAGCGHFRRSAFPAAFESCQDLIGIGWFAEVIGCSESNGVDGGGNAAISGQDDHARMRGGFPESPEDVQSGASATQLQVENSLVKLPGLDVGPGFCGRAGSSNIVAPPAKCGGKTLAKGRVIIHNQKFVHAELPGGNRRQACVPLPGVE